MKQILITEQAAQTLNQLAHHALKGVGIEAFNAVKALEAWLATAIDMPEVK